MSSIVEKLSTRGYWRTEIRPTDFHEKHVPSLALLERSVRAAVVELRGWDFPHLGNESLLLDSQNSIGSDTDWRVHVETWRAFLSGQFVHRGGLWVDWMDQDFLFGKEPNWKPASQLPIVDCIWSLTERFEFAARLSQTEMGAEGMAIRVSFTGLKGRTLRGDHPRRHWGGFYSPATLSEFVFERTLSRADLLATASELAVEASQELFGFFGYQAETRILRDIQAELSDKPGRKQSAREA